MEYKIIKSIGNILKLLLLLPTGVIALVYIWSLFNSPLSFKEMDLNEDGWVSFSEADYTGNYGIRKVGINGKTCTEYFAYKDGLSIKVVCDAEL
ncbi:hypothetical protein [Methylophaga thalassica]|uniref:hypothetical protein n=1 Tax=Methylophaga aminisulfidivorans TaxID=230105 RepID=UPI003A8DEBEE